MHRLKYIFLASFIAVQLLSVLHLAEHKNTDHTHNGQACEIYFHAQHFGNALLPDVEPFIITAASFRHLVQTEQQQVTSYNFNSFNSRAPPHIS